jgi:outer membrane receptor for ferrienterochelin and colicins
VNTVYIVYSRRGLLFFISIFLIFYAASGYSQLRVLDKQSLTPIAGASVLIKNSHKVKLSEGTTNDKGIFNSNYLSSYIIVKAVGYKPVDTFAKETNMVLYLEPTIMSLKEVGVSIKSRQATTLVRSPFRIQVFSRQQIDDKGAVNMGDLLSTELNAKVINNGSDGSSLLLQGLSGQNVKILVDGVPQVMGMSNEVDLQQLNLANAERVELVEGPLSVQFGTNALAGTLNIITKKMEPGKNIAFGGSLYGESVEQYNGSAWIGVRLKSWNVMLDGSYSDFGGYASLIYRSHVNNPTKTVRGYNWSPKQQINGGLKIYRQWKGLNIGLQYNKFHQNIDNKGEQDPATAYLTATDNQTISDRHNANIYANGKLAEDTYLDIANSYGGYRLDNAQYLVNVQNGTRKVLENPVDQFHTWTFRAAYSKFDIGSSAINYQLGYDINLNNGSGESITDNARAINDVGIYGGAGLKLFDQIDLGASFRYIYNSRYDAKKINLFNADLPVVPSINLKWQLFSDFSLSGSFTKAFRAPSFLELYREFINGSHYIIGNQLLIPELADNYMATAQWRKDMGQHQISIRVSFYNNRIVNKIEMVQPDRSTLPRQYQDIQVPRTYTNIPLFKTEGINFNVGYSKISRFSFSPGLGWLARSGSNSDGHLFHSYDLNAQAMYHLEKIDVRLVAFYKYNGAMAQFGIDEYGKLADQYLGSYQLLDASAVKTFWNKKISLTIGMKNLLNVTDVIQTGMGTMGLVAGTADFSAVPIAWGRTAFIKLTLTL